MGSFDTTRRGFLAAGTVAMATALPAARASAACGGLTREKFMEYVGYFNANDQRFLQFYHDDVQFELGATTIRTPKGIKDFYADVKAHVKETVQVTHFVSDATGIAAELPTEFKVIKDWENGYFQRPLKAGMVMRTISLGMYWVENGKFKQIKAARWRQVHDWRMEA